MYGKIGMLVCVRRCVVALKPGVLLRSVRRLGDYVGSLCAESPTRLMPVVGGHWTGLFTGGLFKGEFFIGPRALVG